jgi:hypothetical protein
MSRTSATFTDRLRRDWFFVRFSWYMQDYPGREYRRIRQELRAEITAAAADVGMVAALHDLGHPRVLADGYKAELPKRLPRFVTGAVAAALTVGAIAYLHLAYTLGVIETLESVGGGSFTSGPFGTVTSVTVADDGIAMLVTPTMTSWLVNVGLGLAAFVLGSRLWRALRRRG